MKILSQKETYEAVSILREGGLISFPTETVFGLGVVYDNEESYKRMINVKKRPPEKPFTMMCADPKNIKKYAKLNNFSKKIIKNFMPGQLTLITTAKENLPSWCVSKDGFVGLRVPDLDFVREMIRKVGKPLLVPSANKSGETPANTDKEVFEIFKNEIDAVIEGESNSKTPSTIVLVDGNNIKLIREGIISLKDIEEALK